MMKVITNLNGKILENTILHSIDEVGEVANCTLKNSLDKVRTKKVYLASPSHFDEELLDMVKVLGVLRNKGLNVFCPYENKNKDLEFGSREWREKTFCSYVSNIDDTDVVVAIVSGNYTDGGTAWEIGYAYAIKKPIILVNLNKEPISLMLSYSLLAYIDSIEKLEKYNFNTLEEISYKGYMW